MLTTRRRQRRRPWTTTEHNNIILKVVQLDDDDGIEQWILSRAKTTQFAHIIGHSCTHTRTQSTRPRCDGWVAIFTHYYHYYHHHRLHYYSNIFNHKLYYYYYIPPTKSMYTRRWRTKSFCTHSFLYPGNFLGTTRSKQIYKHFVYNIDGWHKVLFCILYWYRYTSQVVFVY